MFDDFDTDDDNDRETDTATMGFDLGDGEPSGGSYATPDEEYPVLGHARTTSILVGHDATEAHLLSVIKSGRMPQGLLLAGPESIGKATLAWRLARYLLANPAEEEGGSLFGDTLPKADPTSLSVPTDHPVFRLVAANAHPDLLTIERKMNEEKGTQKNIIDVDQIREIAAFMHLKPSVDGGWRVVIVDDADTMNLNAQNALLKILEEPPPQSMLLLVAHRQGQLLPTIYSRVQRLVMRRLSDNDCRSLLDNDPNWRDMAQSMQTLCLHLGNGAPGQMLKLVAQIENNGFSEMLEDLSLYAQKPAAAMHRLSERVGGPGADDRFRIFQLLLTHIARLGVLKAHGAGPQGHLPEQLAPMLDDLTARLGPPRLVGLYDSLQELFRKTLTQSLDRRLAAMEALALWRPIG